MLSRLMFTRLHKLWMLLHAGIGIYRYKSYLMGYMSACMWHVSWSFWRREQPEERERSCLTLRRVLCVCLTRCTDLETQSTSQSCSICTYYACVLQLQLPRRPSRESPRDCTGQARAIVKCRIPAIHLMASHQGRTSLVIRVGRDRHYFGGMAGWPVTHRDNSSTCVSSSAYRAQAPLVNRLAQIGHVPPTCGDVVHCSTVCSRHAQQASSTYTHYGTRLYMHTYAVKNFFMVDMHPAKHQPPPRRPRNV